MNCLFLNDFLPHDSIYMEIFVFYFSETRFWESFVFVMTTGWQHNFLLGLSFQAQGIHAINLGDSGFMVVREGCTIFRSPVQQHDFNFTYQLESGTNGDLPSSGQVCAYCSFSLLFLQIPFMKEPNYSLKFVSCFLYI